MTVMNRKGILKHSIAIATRGMKIYSTRSKNEKKKSKFIVDGKAAEYHWKDPFDVFAYVYQSERYNAGHDA